MSHPSAARIHDWCLSLLLGATMGVGVLVGSAASAQELRIAAASDLQAALPEIVTRFKAETKRDVQTTFGSSGNFFAQLQNGAPFDVFFSADVDYPRRLEAAGLTDPGSRFSYAIGRIVIWTRKDSGIDLHDGLRVVTDPRVRHLAIANPDHAPYGRAAVAALQHEKLYDAVRAKLVLGENISQAAQFAQSGTAEVGILALSLALSPAFEAAGRYVEIPVDWHPPIEQAAVIMKTSPHIDLARRFLAFVKSPAIAGLLETFGFVRPPAGRGFGPA